MRKKIVAGNWKMNLDLAGSQNLASEICSLVAKNPLSGLKSAPSVVLFPPSVFINGVSTIVNDTPGVSVGAQNIHQNEKGAFTGEVSAQMVASCGATYTLIGHSERRSYFGEDDKLIAEKIAAAFKSNLVPMYCCGEVLAERQDNKHFDIVKHQVETALFWMEKSQFEKVVIAYEPVWAIGTGVTASPRQAQEMHSWIRQLVATRYGIETANKTTILYGGSCNGQNAVEIFAQPDVDGGLIGGASLKAEEFFTIISSF
ncbi:MAG TPA: triose-phosphate isomerase [Bacteroidales bacterium]|nr:triose-phosphate isomerase [Bacteroidales bacterium]